MSTFQTTDDLATGFRFATVDVVRDADYQRRKHIDCGVDPDLYGEWADPNLFGQDAFRIMVGQGFRIDGIVHLEQLTTQYRPVPVGERLTARGRVARRETVPRGIEVDRVFDFADATGQIAISSTIRGLIPDPAKMGQPGGSARPLGADPRDGFRKIGAKVMTPEDVTNFSADVGNQIHFDPVFAQHYGYRAPIAQGLQTAIWLGAALIDGAPPQTIDTSTRFRRPIHWDDAVELWVARPSDTPDTEPLRIARAVAANGRVAAEQRIHSITR